MINKHLKHLCQHFNLGCVKQEPKRVYGGLLHIMWRLDTDKDSYAIKQLSKDINLTDERVIRNYELSERIASRFITQGIPAVSAIEKSGKYLFMIDGTGFLVYPWVDAKALDKDAVSTPHALKVAQILFKMHLINLQVPEIEEVEFDIHDDDNILALIAKAESFDCPFSDDLRKNQSNLLYANKAYQNAIPVLKAHSVVSHGDLDQKNVLWDSSNNPILIDWESARKLNPTYEIVNAALDWSGITTHFDKKLFAQMIGAYKEAGGVIDEWSLEAAFSGVLGNWINWLVYNIERSCVLDESEQKTMGIEQVNQTLATILRLQVIIPEVIKNMQGKHSLSDQSIIGYLNNYYGIEVHTLTLLPIGSDLNALVYKADAADKSYFIKLKRGIHDDVSIAIMNLLDTAGLQQIILPLTTINGQPVQHIEGHTLIVYPFVVGENGFNQVLTQEQWLLLGTALRKLHEVDVPISLQRRLLQETYSPKWRDSVLSIYAYIETEPTLDGIALALYSFMKDNAETILRLVSCAEQLAQKLKSNSPQFVLCHSDIHAGNVLIDANNAIYIVDWDDPIMAPKERDLMFIGGGVGNVWNMPHEEALLYKGYGKTEINKTVLAYYRHERIVEDIAEYGESIFFTAVSNEVKLENYNHFKSMFEPRGVVEIAFETMQSSPS